MSIYRGQASVVIDLSFEVESNSLEEAKEKIFNSYGMEFELYDEKGKYIFAELEVNDWYIVEKESQGNVQQSNIRDFEIHEEW